MMFLFALLLLAFSASAKVDWEFYTSETGVLFANTSVGTPGQSFSIRLVISSYCHDLFLERYGGFNPNNSTTFKNVTNSVSSDTFAFQSLDTSVQTLNNVEFIVMDGSYSCDNQVSYYLNIAPSSQNNFLNSVFKQSEESVIVFRYNNTPTSPLTYFTGTLTLGGKPDVCSEFYYTNATNNALYADWGFEIDRFSVGKFAAVTPGAASVGIDDNLFFMPYAIYSSVYDELKLSTGSIPCNTTTEIIIRVGGFDLVMKPDDYIDRQFESDDGNCMFNGYGWENYYFQLPYTLLRNRCMLYDFKNNRVAFSDKSG